MWNTFIKNCRLITNKSFTDIIEREKYLEHDYDDNDNIITNAHINLKSGIKTLQICRLTVALNCLGFNLDKVGSDVLLDKSAFENNYKKTIKTTSLFTKTDDTEKLFNKEIPDITNIKQFMGFMNGILHEWGLCIKVKQKISKTKGYDRKSVRNNNFYLSYWKNIDQYL